MKERISFFISSLAGGGAEKGLVNLLNYMDPDKYDIRLYISAPYFERCKEIHVPVKLDYLPGKGRLLAGKKTICKTGNQLYQLQKAFEGSFLRRLLSLQETDVFFMFMDSPQVALFARYEGQPVTILRMSIDYEKYFDDFIGSTSPAARRRHICLSKQSDYIVAPSEYAKEAYIRATGISHNLVRIYNINDPLELESQAAQFIPETPRKGIVMVAVGRLNEQKGYLRLIDACARLYNEGLDFTLWILGEGPQRMELEAEIKRLNLSNIYLLGYHDNPYPYIKAADIYVCASYFEGLSNAAKEAMLLGLPCVVTDCSGMSEIFGCNSEYGLITENSDKGIYMGLRRMLTDKELYNGYREKVLERRDCFSPAQSLSDYEKLFHKELKP